MRQLAVILIALFAAPFAGCMGEDAPGATTAGGPAAPEAILSEQAAAPLPNVTADVPVDAPTWAKGDAWIITSQFGGETEQSVLAVAAADSGGYTLVTTSQGAATYDAMFDVSYIGRIRASDLAGMQQGSPVQFFSFPLKDGKAWTTTWDGLEVSLSAAFAPAIDTPLGPQPGFLITGTIDGEPFITYDYVPALGWWSKVTWAMGFGFQVDQKVTGWSGSYLVAESKDLMTLTSALPIGNTPEGSFIVEEGQTSVSVFIDVSESRHLRGFFLTDPAHMPYMTSTESISGHPSAAAYSGEERLPPTPGEWRVFAPGLHDPGASITIVAKQVKVEMVELS